MLNKKVRILETLISIGLIFLSLIVMMYIEILGWVIFGIGFLLMASVLWRRLKDYDNSNF